MTAAAILREGALYMKREAEEIKRYLYFTVMFNFIPYI